MNEEIIIDGVNVSECCADKKMMKDGLYCFWEGGSCKNNEYCYYKELKRLEQKYNEVLKLSKKGMDAQEYCLREDDEIIRNLKEEHNHYIDVINELKKENETIKRTIKEWEHSDLTLRQENQELKNRKDNYYVKTLDQEAQISDLIQENEELKEENKEINSRMAEVTYRATGGRLSYSNYTLDAIEDAYYDAVRIEVEQRTEELEEELKESKKAFSNVLYLTSQNNKKNEDYRHALEEIREITKKCDLPPCLNFDCKCDICPDEITQNGKRCMQKGMRKIQKILNKVLESEEK